MIILSICDNGDLLSVFKIVNVIILLVKILVPIALILSVMIDYMKAVLNHEDLPMTNKMFVNKVMAAVLVFFIPTFVNIIIKVVDPSGMSYVACLNNATTENIEAAYIRTSSKRVDEVRETLLRGDYLIAQSYVRKIKDEVVRQDLEKELDETLVYIKISEEVDELSKNYNAASYNEIQSKIGDIYDESVKEKLNEKLRDSKSSGSSYSGVNINPNDPKYTNSKFLIGESLTSFLMNRGSSVEDLNTKIRNAVISAGVGTRAGTVAAAVTLIDSLSEMGKKLNYQWGGKYEFIGVNPNWGNPDSSTDCYGSYASQGYTVSKCLNNYQWKSLDCSGFVTWAVINGMQNASITQSQVCYATGGGTRVDLDPNRAVCRPGEALDTKGHIVLVVGTDDSTKEYIVAESTGSTVSDGTGGIIIKRRPYGSSGYHCLHLENIYGN